jgi:hypothetical protein
VGTTFRGLGSYRDEVVQAFIDRVVPVIAAGQLQTAMVTNAFLSSQMTEMFGAGAVAGTITPETVTGAATRNGTDPAAVYRRPAVEVYTALKQGFPLDAAVERGVTRINSLVATDMQLARTHATVATFNGSGVQYYRRRLNGSKNCALCIVASTQRYRTDKLMPCHPGCQCRPEPIQGNNVPHVLDKARLDELHTAVERLTGEKADRTGRDIADYRKIMVTHEHGEYGPTLAYRGQHFDGPKDVKLAATETE